MGAFVHRVVVLSLSLALVVSAATFGQCPVLQAMANTAAANHHVHGSGAGMHDHNAMHHHHADQKPAKPGADHDCLKCCAMCTATTTLPASPAQTVSLIAVTVDYFSGQEKWSAAAIRIDPGIPKRIV